MMFPTCQEPLDKVVEFAYCIANTMQTIGLNRFILFEMLEEIILKIILLVKSLRVMI